MGAINEVWKEPRYYMYRCLDGTYSITRGVPNFSSPVVKSDLTKSEAEVWLKLLKGN